MRYLLLTFSLLISSLALTQQPNQAYVIDLNYLCKTGSAVNLSRFPFYFEHKEFVADVQDEISKQLKKKFQLQNVYFINEDSINYMAAGGAIKTEAKRYAQLTGRPNTLYVSVETIIQDYATVGEEHIYRFITRVNVYNDKGKRIYKFKNVIPFVSVYTDNITGFVEMSENDFYAFYFDGLVLAFEGKYDQITKRYIEKPTALTYQPFVSSAEKFFLKVKYNGFYYGRSLEEQKKVMNYGMKNSNPDDVELMFTQLVTVENLNKGFLFHNLFDDNDYKVCIKGGVSSLRNVTDPDAEFIVQLLSDESTVLGEFNFDENNYLTGKVGDKKIRFTTDKKYYNYIINMDEKLVALINPLIEYDVVYLYPDISLEELTDLMNIYFAHLFAQGIRRYIYQSFY